MIFGHLEPVAGDRSGDGDGSQSLVMVERGNIGRSKTSGGKPGEGGDDPVDRHPVVAVET